MRCASCRHVVLPLPGQTTWLPAWAAMDAGSITQFAGMRRTGCRHAVLGLPVETACMQAWAAMHAH
jgi:hypothetical protein